MVSSLTLQLFLVTITTVGSVIINPSGTCSAEGNGGRQGYHTPGPSDMYLPNCKNPLKRELWRVFQKEDGTAYMIPRPDGLGIGHGVCDFLNDVGEKAKEYGLCTDTDTADPSIINSMDPTYALVFSTLFHRQLKFEAEGDAIVPWVPDDDILLACEALGDGVSSDLQSLCDEVEQRCDGQGICKETVLLSSHKNALGELATALNDIYGVRILGDTCTPDVWGETFGCAVAMCVEPPTGCTYKSVFEINDQNDCCEKFCYAVDSEGNECTFDDTSGGSASVLSTVTSVILPLLMIVALATLF